MIEVSGAAPASPGTISVDAQVARRTAGALGEPFRVLSLLPGVATSIAASGYPIIRGTLPGESRFVYDGIEIPMLYHLLLGNQVMHPSFIGDLQLRAGASGPEQGHLLGGLVTLTPAPVDGTRTELSASLTELGAFRAQRLSAASSLAAAVRVGTLTALARLYGGNAAVDYFDQQARYAHRLGNGDELTLTSLGAFDHVELPSGPEQDHKTFRLGFHRFDARWTRRRPGGELRAGVQTAFDSLRSVITHEPRTFIAPGPDGIPVAMTLPPEPTERNGGRAYGARVYADGGLRIAPWLSARGGVEAHRSTLVNRAPLFSQLSVADPFLSFAREVDSEGAWAALDLHAGPVTITPGVRAESFHAELQDVPVRNSAIDPRLAIAADLPGGARAELAGGLYTAPPQVSIVEGPLAIGPLPASEGTAAGAGLSHGMQAQLSVQMPLPAGWQASLAAYYRDIAYAVDFGLLDRQFTSHTSCDAGFSTASIYRNVTTRAMGIEAMARRELSRSVTGWLSYSLGKIDRDYGFVQLPHDYDQRHTLNATLQWQLGAWRLGSSAHVHSGRPSLYPRIERCGAGPDGDLFDTTEDDPTYLRRVPASWRIDLRVERALKLAGFPARIYFEMQNASLTREVLRYQVEYPRVGRPRVTEDTLFLPLPILGMEITL